MPLAPNVLPGRAFQQVNRQSRALLHWRAADLSLTPLTGEVPTLTRAGAGGYILDRHGRLRNVGQQQSRFDIIDQVTPALLLEGASTNRITDSENFGAWSAFGTPVRTGGQRDPMGGAAAYLLEDNDAGGDEGYYLPITFVGDGEKAASLFLAPGTAGATRVTIRDETAAVIRHDMVATWTNGVPALTEASGTGALFTPRRCAYGFYRCGFSAPGVVAANTNRMYIYPAGTAGGALGTVYAFGAQAEDAPTPSSYIRTVGGTAPRVGEVMSFAKPNLVPQLMTVYVAFYDRGSSRVASLDGRVLHIGALSDSAQARFEIYHQTSNWLAVHVNSGSAAATVADGVPALPATLHGTLIELRAVLRADGSVLIGRSNAGAAEVVGSASAALAMAPTWAGAPTVVQLNRMTTDGQAAYRSVKIAAGERTMEEMRELF